MLIPYIHFGQVSVLACETSFTRCALEPAKYCHHVPRIHPTNPRDLHTNSQCARPRIEDPPAGYIETLIVLGHQPNSSGFLYNQPTGEVSYIMLLKQLARLKSLTIALGNCHSYQPNDQTTSKPRITKQSDHDNRNSRLFSGTLHSLTHLKPFDY